MPFDEVLKVGLVVLGSLGGGAAIVAGFSGFLGRLWADRLAERQRLASEAELTNMRGRLDDALARLNAALEHRTFLLQRLATIELEGLTRCWKFAKRAHILVNGIRPDDAGTDAEALKKRLDELSDTHNELLSACGEFDPFLEDPIRDLLEEVRRIVALELSQASRDHFSPRWWDQGLTNRVACEQRVTELRGAVRQRIAALRQLAVAEANG